MADSDFRNVAPVGRQSRRPQPREEVEKARLAARREGFHRYEDVGKIHEAARGTVQHIDESDRFQTDTAAEEKRRRDDQLRARDAYMSTKREATVAAEEARWAAIDAQRRQEEERGAAMAGTSRRNNNSVAYDPITLRYNDDEEGRRLRAQDDARVVRQEARKEMLQSKATSVTYNLLTGEPK